MKLFPAVVWVSALAFVATPGCSKKKSETPLTPPSDDPGVVSTDPCVDGMEYFTDAYGTPCKNGTCWAKKSEGNIEDAVDATGMCYPEWLVQCPVMDPQLTPERLPTLDCNVVPELLNLGLGCDDQSCVWIQGKNFVGPEGCVVTFFQKDLSSHVKATSESCTDTQITVAIPDQVKGKEVDIVVTNARQNSSSPRYLDLETGSTKPPTPLTPDPPDTGTKIWVSPNIQKYLYGDGDFDPYNNPLGPSPRWKNLFVDEAGWGPTVDKIDYYSFHAHHVGEIFESGLQSELDFLDQAIAFLNKHKIKLSLEIPAPDPLKACTQWVTYNNHAVGEITANYLNKILRNLHRRGAVVRTIVLDGPISQILKKGRWYTGGCQLSLSESINQLAIFMNKVFEAFPHVKFGYWVNLPGWRFGDIPPHPDIRKPMGGRDGTLDFKNVLKDVVEKLKNEPVHFSFVNVDNPYNYVLREPRGWEKLSKLGEYVKSLGMRYGIAFNYPTEQKTYEPAQDQLFVEKSLLFLKNYAAIHNQIPDNVFFASWYQNPGPLLPFNQSFSFFDYVWRGIVSIQHYVK